MQVEQQGQPQAQPGQLSFTCMSRWPTWPHTLGSSPCSASLVSRTDWKADTAYEAALTLYLQAIIFFFPLRIIRWVTRHRQAATTPSSMGRKCLTARAEHCSGKNVTSSEWVQRTTHIITLLKYAGWIWGRCSVYLQHTEVFPRLSWILLQALVSAETPVSVSQQHFSIHD